MAATTSGTARGAELGRTRNTAQRLSTETKHSSKTSEFIAMVAVVLGPALVSVDRRASERVAVMPGLVRAGVAVIDSSMRWGEGVAGGRDVSFRNEASPTERHAWSRRTAGDRACATAFPAAWPFMRRLWQPAASGSTEVPSLVGCCHGPRRLLKKCRSVAWRSRCLRGRACWSEMSWSWGRRCAGRLRGLGGEVTADRVEVDQCGGPCSL